MYTKIAKILLIDLISECYKLHVTFIICLFIFRPYRRRITAHQASFCLSLVNWLSLLRVGKILRQPMTDCLCPDLIGHRNLNLKHANAAMMTSLKAVLSRLLCVLYGLYSKSSDSLCAQWYTCYTA